MASLYLNAKAAMTYRVLCWNSDTMREFNNVEMAWIEKNLSGLMLGYDHVQITNVTILAK